MTTPSHHPLSHLKPSTQKPEPITLNQLPNNSIAIAYRLLPIPFHEASGATAICLAKTFWISVCNLAL